MQGSGCEAQTKELGATDVNSIGSCAGELVVGRSFVSAVLVVVLICAEVVVVLVVVVVVVVVVGYKR